MLREELQKFLNRPGDVVITEVEKGAIRRFAEAVGDPNPLYLDEEYAKNSRYGSIIAPPGFFGWAVKGGRGDVLSSEAQAELREALREAGYRRSLDGGMEFEFFKPVRAGDKLAATVSIKDVIERETSRSGKMAFTIIEVKHINQDGDLVAISRKTSIS